MALMSFCSLATSFDNLIDWKHLVSSANMNGVAKLIL